MLKNRTVAALYKYSSTLNIVILKFSNTVCERFLYQGKGRSPIQENGPFDYAILKQNYVFKMLYYNLVVVKESIIFSNVVFPFHVIIEVVHITIVHDRVILKIRALVFDTL